MCILTDYSGIVRLTLFPHAQWQAPSHRVEKMAAAATSQGFLIDFLHSTYNFALGGLAGGLGAIAVYPIDLVKTR